VPAPRRWPRRISARTARLNRAEFDRSTPARRGAHGPPWGVRPGDFFALGCGNFKSTATRRRFQLAVSFGTCPSESTDPSAPTFSTGVGKVSEEDCLSRAGVLEMELSDLATSSPLPEEPENERVEQ
jgi:hypothetical protein